MNLWWKVRPIQRNGDIVDGEIRYSFFGNERLVCGFKGYDRVFSRITEEENRIVARFYRGPADAKADKDVIKEVVFSEKRNSGNGTDWAPLKRPVVIFSSSSNTTQSLRVRSRGLRDILLADLPEGEAIELEPRRVDLMGYIRFSFDRMDENEGGSIICTGLQGYIGRKLPGRLIVRNGRKTAYFWASKAALKRGDPPVKPEGHIMAEFDPRAAVQSINWNRSSKAQMRRNATIEYREFLFEDAEDEVFFNTWPAKIIGENDHRRVKSFMRVYGVTMSLVISTHLNISRLFAVTREIGERIKLVEFWGSEGAFWLGEMPLDARFITFKSDRSEWISFWKRMDDWRSLRRLARKDHITRRELNRVFSTDYLIDYHGKSVLRVVDGLNLYEEV